MSDSILDIVPAEHFPTCPCFSDRESDQSEVLRQRMYSIAQAASLQVVVQMRESEMCAGAVPHLLAMLVHMVVAGRAGQEAHGDPLQWTQRMGDMLDQTVDRQRALMARAMMMIHSDGGGSVQ